MFALVFTDKASQVSAGFKEGQDLPAAHEGLLKQLWPTQAHRTREATPKNASVPRADSISRLLSVSFERMWRPREAHCDWRKTKGPSRTVQAVRLTLVTGSSHNYFWAHERQEDWQPPAWIYHG